MFSCSEQDEPEYVDPENSIEGQQGVGIKRLDLSIPRLGLFDVIIDRLDCKLHLKGTVDHVTYPVFSRIKADKDSLYLTVVARDSVLKKLPHQMYHLNYITAARNKSRADEADNDTIYLGARLSIEDPNNIGFRSSFNLQSNSIGSGTKDDPTPITCGKDFQSKIADALTEGKTLQGHVFELTDNINFAYRDATIEKGWEPAGHYNLNGAATPFEGELTGNGNFIELLFSHSDSGYSGLFYQLGDNAYIHDIQFRSITIEGGRCAGCISSISSPNTKFENIRVDGSVSGSGDLGGLVGQGGGNFKNCISAAAVNGYGDNCNVGGFIGKADKNTVFNGCVRVGNVTGENATNIGGYVGGNDGRGDVEISNCVCAGTISGAGNVGGFVGKFSYDRTIYPLTFINSTMGATVADGSYAYPWQPLLNIHQNSSIAPFKIIGTSQKGKIGGFVGEADRITLNGENEVAYEHNSVPPIQGSSTCYAGGLAGYVTSSIDMKNGGTFVNRASITCDKYAGGIVGAVHIGTSDNFYSCATSGSMRNEGSVYANEFAGGIFGATAVVRGGKYVNNGAVSGKNCVGGVAGLSHGISGGDYVVQGHVSGQDANIGGAIGQLEGTLAPSTLKIGDVNTSMSVTGDHNVGGFVGYYYNRGIHTGKVFDNTQGMEIHANVVGQATTGGMCGYMKYDDTNATITIMKGDIRESYVGVTVKNGAHAGGVIGYLDFYGHQNPIPDAYIGGVQSLYGTVTGSGDGAAGIIGQVSSPNARVHVTDVVNNMNVSCTRSSGVTGYGGIIGCMTEDKGVVYVERSANRGSVIGAAVSGGAGIAGYVQHGIRVEECYNEGTIDVPYACGGIVGRLIDYGVIYDCYNVGDVVWGPSKSLVGGILAHKEDKNDQKVYLQRCYNAEDSGWGSMGGEEDCELDSRDVYYLNVCNDMPGSGANKRTADEMRRFSTFNGFQSSGKWTINEGHSAPTLVNAPAPKIIPLAK